jgi:hypothetical protein
MDIKGKYGIWDFVSYTKNEYIEIFLFPGDHNLTWIGLICQLRIVRKMHELLHNYVLIISVTFK